MLYLENMIKIVDVPIYKCSVVFLIEATREEWLQFFNEQKPKVTDADNTHVLEDYDEETIGFTLQTEQNDYICYVNNKDRLGLVAHEIFHAANMILVDRNFKIDYAGEAWAYLIEFLINEFYLAIDDNHSTTQD